MSSLAIMSLIAFVFVALFCVALLGWLDNRSLREILHRKHIELCNKREECDDLRRRLDMVRLAIARGDVEEDE